MVQVQPNDVAVEWIARIIHILQVSGSILSPKAMTEVFCSMQI